MSVDVATKRRLTASPMQRTLRRRASGIELQTAVSQTVEAVFAFTHRASNAKALWSDEWVVWLGRSTYLHWALNDVEINIPWIVAKATDAPRNSADLRKAVQAELTSYFAERLSALPRKSTGNWLPLP